MIIKDIQTPEKRIVWYKRKDSVYVFEIKDNEYNFKKRIPIRKRKKKKMKKYFYMILVSLLLKDHAIIGLENPEMYKTFLNWEKMDQEEKEKLMLQQMEKLALKNVEYPDNFRDALKEKYETFLEEYGKYYSRWDYLSTLYSTRFVKVEEMEPIKEENDELIYIETGKYNHIFHRIKVIDNENSFFHEKLHADDYWFGNPKLWNSFIKDDFEKEAIQIDLEDELFASFGSNSGYSDLRASIILIGELGDREELTKNIAKKDLEKIWGDLSEVYPKDKVVQLEDLLLKIYRKTYRKGEEALLEKQAFWNLYKEIYQEKYNMAPENDLIVSFMKDKFFSFTVQNDQNKINYDNTYKIYDMEFDLENRNQNYREAITQKLLCLNIPEHPYFDSIWINVTVGGLNEWCASYKEFESALAKYMTEKEITSFFYAMLNCKTESERDFYISWAVEKINLEELNLRLSK